MNEEIEKMENHGLLYFIFSCHWSWAFNRTLSQGQGNPLPITPACQRATHKHTFSWVAQPAARSTSLVWAEYVTLDIPLTFNVASGSIES